LKEHLLTIASIVVGHIRAAPFFFGQPMPEREMRRALNNVLFYLRHIPFTDFGHEVHA
jgi:hypothetical protein